MILSGFKRSVFAQFSGPIIITLQNLPSSHACTSLKVSAKTRSVCYSAAAQHAHLRATNRNLRLALHQNHHSRCFFILNGNLSFVHFPGVLNEIIKTFDRPGQSGLQNLSILPLFFCFLLKETQCSDVYRFLLKTHRHRIE